MSEYQHYEFQALDRPLSNEDQAYIRTLSSRVQLTATTAQFVYHYGDFRGKPQEVLDRCFDMMVYIANFGVRRLMIRFPKALMNPALLEPYCIEGNVSILMSARSLILDIQLVSEGYYGWLEETEYLASLVPLREELLRGDLRLMYLAWLAAGDAEDNPNDPEESIEPPVPPNLKQLSPALQAFADLFEIDEDLIAAAAVESEVAQPPTELISDWIAALSEADRIAYLLRVVQGETHVGAELMQRLRQEFGSVAVPSRSETGRTFAQLKVIAAEQQQIHELKQQKAAEVAKQKRLAELAPKAEALWQEVMRLIALAQSKSYDEAVAHLLTLQDLAEYQGTLPDFQQRIESLKQQYSNRPGLLARLRDVKL